MNTSSANATASARTRPPAAIAVGCLAIVGTAGAIFMSLAHMGVGVPLIGGGQMVLPVAIGMAVGAALYAAVAYAAFTQASWAWPAALAVNGIALVATLGPPTRGASELVPIIISLVALAILVSPAGRAALRRRT